MQCVDHVVLLICDRYENTKHENHEKPGPRELSDEREEVPGRLRQAWSVEAQISELGLTLANLWSITSGCILQPDGRVGVLTGVVNEMFARWIMTLLYGDDGFVHCFTRRIRRSTRLSLCPLIQIGRHERYCQHCPGLRRCFL